MCGEFLKQSLTNSSNGAVALGFIDYAWAVSLQKDETKVKILQDPALIQPVLQSDNFGFTIKLPTVHMLEDGNISFLGLQIPRKQRWEIQNWQVISSLSYAFNSSYFSTVFQRKNCSARKRLNRGSIRQIPNQRHIR